MREPGETRRRRRGQPLLVLVVVLAGWVGLRGSFGEAPGFLEPEPARPIARQAVLPRPAPVALGKPGEFAWHDAEMVGGRAEPAPPTALGQALRDDAMSMAVARQMLWMAALANVPLPVAMEDVSQHEAPQPVPEERELVVLGHYPQEQGQVAPRAARWSGDGWLLVRQGGGRVGAGSAPYGPTYGANQIGAVLRYRLDAEDAHKPSLFLRGYGALNGTGEGEVAFGLSGRLLPQVPVVAMIEARASHFMSGATHVRSAAS